jgi:hypothetical protein
MTRDNLKLVRQWTQRPEEAFVRNLRLRALPSPNLALACRVAAENAGAPQLLVARGHDATVRTRLFVTPQV